MPRYARWLEKLQKTLAPTFLWLLLNSDVHAAQADIASPKDTAKEASAARDTNTGDVPKTGAASTVKNRATSSKDDANSAPDTAGEPPQGSPSELEPAVLAKPQPASTEPPAVDHGELLARAEEVTRELEQIRRLLKVPSEVKKLDSFLDERVPLLKEAAEKAKNEIVGASRWFVVNDIQFEFAGRSMRLAELRAPLDKFSKDFGPIPKRIEAISVEWKNSRKILGEIKAPEPVIARVDELLRAANHAHLHAARTESEIAQLSATLERVDSTILEVLELSKKDAPSLLSDFLLSTNAAPPPIENAERSTRSIVRVLKKHRQNWSIFVKLNRARLLFHSLLLLVLGFALYRARALYRADGIDGSDERHVVLRHPLASSFLICALAILPIYPILPAIAGFLGIVTAIVASNFIVAEEDESRIFISASFVTLLFIGARMLLAETPGLERIMLGAEGVWVLLGGAVLLRGKTLPWTGIWATLVRWVVRVWLAAAGTGLILWNLGIERSATILIDGTARLFLITIAYRVGYEALTSMVTLIVVSPWARKLNAFVHFGQLISTRIKTALRWLFFLLWIRSAFRAYALIGHVSELIDEFLAKKLEAGSLSVNVGDLLAIVVGLVLAVVVAKVLRFVLTEDLMPRTSLAVGTQAAITSGAYYVILGFGIFTTLAASGFQLDRVAILVSALGVGIGFGLQNVVQNFVAGILLIFGRPINVGDTVQVGDLIGRVREIGFRASTVYTVDGAEVIVPNSQFISEQVINWTLTSERRRVLVDLGVKYGTEPQDVLDILLEVARGHVDVLSDPAIEAVFISFGDSALNFQLRAWTDKGGDWVRIRSDLSIGINSALKKAGIEIPFPQRDLNLRSIDGAAAEMFARSNRSTPSNG